MNVKELTREQLHELKQNYICETWENPSYDDLCNADVFISDAEIFEKYADAEFSNDDFTCTCEFPPNEDEIIERLETLDWNAHKALNIRSLPMDSMLYPALHGIIAGMLINERINGKPIIEYMNKAVREYLTDNNFHSVNRACDLIKNPDEFRNVYNNTKKYFDR